MFAGRLEEVERLEQALRQTRAGIPTNFLVLGERGIGKSSLLFILKAAAGRSLDEDRKSFLVVHTDLDQSITSLGLVRKVEMGLRAALATSEASREFLREAWKFLKNIEASGFSLGGNQDETVTDAAIEEFAYSLADTVNRVCGAGDGPNVFGATYDGVLLLIDEADNAGRELPLGSFLKLMLERVQRRGCNKLMVVLAELPELRTRLTSSHQSSLRLFDEVELSRLEPWEVNFAIDRGLTVAEELNNRPFNITTEARIALINLSEGFPHFLQQFCYSAFQLDDDDEIDADDVMVGAFDGAGAAMNLIGNRYYREDFYEKIRKESYRQVLRIMAEHLDEWVSKDYIRKQFTGVASTLDNAIYALRDRHIIVSKEGQRGVYRLQNKGFAYWIKVYTTPDKGSLIIE